MAKKAIDDPTSISSQVGTQPAVIFPALRDGDKTIPLRQLVRIVAALPLHEFTTLNDAFVQEKNHWGSGELAARELTKHARARRLTVAARWVERGGIEHVGILRSAFWRYYKIVSAFPFEINRPEGTSVLGPPLAGRWYFFVGRRRLDRLHSTPAPSKPVAQRPSPKQSQPQDDRRLTLLPEKLQFEAPRKRRPEEAMRWLAEKMANDPPKSGDRSDWARRHYPEMKNDFGEDDIPWKDWTVLRRRMNDIKT
jgi:hypothetical protein